MWSREKERLESGNDLGRLKNKQEARKGVRMHAWRRLLGYCLIDCCYDTLDCLDLRSVMSMLQ